MKIITRYIVRHFLTLLAIILPSIISLYLVIEVFQRIDDIIEAHVGISIVIIYLILRIPQIVLQLWPIIALLAAILTITILSKRNEVLAIKSCGIGISSILRPIIITTLICSIFLVIIQAFWAPKAESIANHIWQVDIEKKKPKGIITGKSLFFHSKDAIWVTFIDNPRATILNNVRILSYDKHYHTKSFLFAKKAFYINKRWHFVRGIIQEKKQSFWTSTSFKDLDLKLSVVPKDLASITIPPKLMNAIELVSYIKSLRRAGEHAFKERTALWSNITYPLLAVFLSYLGLCIMLFLERTGLSLGLAISLAIGILYWVFWNFLIAFASSGHLLPEAVPLLAMGILWLASSMIKRKILF